MVEKLSSLERCLTQRDVAATHEIESLRAELQTAKTKIERLQQFDDNDDVARYG